ncbi:hypothetical protein T484DRAFT_1821928 [Baffinella frigidus]|nr:hypothetical protein T484DRAFT_1821928 [Cryptophyta sp. CCMP2293]
MTAGAAVNPPEERVEVLNLPAGTSWIMTFSLPEWPEAEAATVYLRVAGAGGAEKEASFPLSFFDGGAVRIVSASPTTVPASREIAGSVVSIPSTVLVTVANLPRGALASDLSAKLGIFSMFVEVVSLVENDFVEGCQVWECNRTVATLLLPALQTLSATPMSLVLTLAGTVLSTLSATPMSLVLTLAGTVLPSVPITFVQSCDYDTLCGATKLPDTASIAAAAKIACVKAFCVQPDALPSLLIDFFSPTEGSVIGGTSVGVTFQNLPASSPADVIVTFGHRYGDIGDLTFDPGSSLLANSGSLTITTPAMPSNAAEVAMVVSVKIKGVVRAATGRYEFFPVYSGPATALYPTAQVAIRRGSDLVLSVEIGNVKRLKKPFSPASYREAIDGAEADSEGIISSSRTATIVSILHAVPEGGWPLGTMALAVYPAVSTFFPRSASSMAVTPIDATLAYFDPSLILSNWSAIIWSGGMSANVAVLSALARDAACAFKDCSLFDLSLSLPPNPLGDFGNDAVLSIRAGDSEANATITYIGDTEASVQRVSPTRQALVTEAAVEPITLLGEALVAEAAVEPIALLVKNFPTADCGQASECAAEAASCTVTFGTHGPGVVSERIDQGGFLVLTVLAPSSATVTPIP